MNQSISPYPRRFADSRAIGAPAEDLFAYLDDHRRMSVHMGRRSLMMAGSRMMVSTDDKKGQSVGSHIRLQGAFLGVPLDVDEVVVLRDPPRRKAWETVGTPRLIVIGSYRMGFEIEPDEIGSVLTVAIDYRLPESNRWMGELFGPAYSRWCVRQILEDARRHFVDGTNHSVVQAGTLSSRDSVKAK